MRKRQARHESQLKSIEWVEPKEVIRRMRVADHAAGDFLDSEVLAAVVRNRVREAEGVVTEAAVVLSKRIQAIVGKRIRGELRAWMIDRGSTVIEDTIGYVWDALLEDEGVSNSEVYFAVFVRDRVDDYMRHLLAQKNSMTSIDAMTVNDEEGNETPLIETIQDDEAETPEEIVMRAQQTAAVRTVLMSLPRAERNAYYFRIVCDYEWKKVAELLRCSVPTARQHFNRSVEKLQGVME